MTEESAKIISGHCPNCRGKRKAFVRGKHIVNWSDERSPISSSDTGFILECCGCSSVYFRRDYWFSEWDSYGQNEYTSDPEIEPGIETTYYPAETTRHSPKWLVDIKIVDAKLGIIVNELFAALNCDLRILAAIGARTAFDRSCELLGVNPALNFNEKLDELVALGKIGKDERVTLDALIDAGSAAAHRGWTPEASELGTMMDIVEAFLHRAFILGDGIKQLKAAVPQMPRRPKKQKKP